MMTMYAQMIQQLTTHDARHVEGYMRAEHSTLDGLSGPQFVRAVRDAASAIDSDGAAMAERVAQSVGL